MFDYNIQYTFDVWTIYTTELLFFVNIYVGYDSLILKFSSFLSYSKYGIF